MATCNVVFWSVVVPTAIYGCEVWIMDAASLDLIEEFQNYVGKRMQRLHSRAPISCSFFGLGWMRLERVIQIRKLMFIRSIIIMDLNALSRKIFCERAAQYFNDVVYNSENICQSTVFDLLNVCDIFGMLDEVRNMIERDHYYPKAMWKEMVWKRGWELEDTYWNIEKKLQSPWGCMC